MLNWPLLYTYRTRLGSYRGLVDFAVRDVLIVTFVASMVFGAQWWLILVAYLGHLALYECGYLINDRSGSAKEHGGSRLKDEIQPRRFWLLRLIVLAVSTGVLWHGAGAVAAVEYLVLTIAVLLLLIAHTQLAASGFLRVFSFTALALYKYAPPVLPLVAASASVELLTAVFVCYGMPRVFVYALRKFGSSTVQSTVEGAHGTFQIATLLLIAPLVWLSAASYSAVSFSALQVTWMLYGSVWVAATLVRSVRRRGVLRAS